MKIVGIILTAFMLLGSAVVGATGSNKSMDLSAEIGAASDVLSAEQMEAAGLPSSARLKIGGMVGIIAALGALTLLLVTCIKRDKVLLVAGGTMTCCIIAILLYPTIAVGPTDGMAPRTQAIVAMALAGLGAMGSLLAKRAGNS